MSNRLRHAAGMGVVGRIAVFAAGLLVVFAGAAGIGSLVDPADTTTGAMHDEGGHAATRHGEGSQAASGLAVSEGDLAFLHVHHYRLYLQFKQAGSVRTAQFTVAVPR